MSGENRVLDLVGSIYDAALDGQLWPDVLNRIGDAVGGPMVVFGIYDPPNGLVNMHAPRTDPDMMRKLADWAPSNPALPCIASQYPPGTAFNGAEVISPEEFSRTAIYQDWWRLAGFSTEPLVTNLFARSVGSGHFASHGLPGLSPSDAQKRLFAVLARHLVRAVVLQRGLHHPAIATERMPADLDELEEGFLLVDAQARLLFVNRTARALLDAGDGLRLDDGALFSSHASDGRRLRELIASCAAAHSTETGFGGNAVVRRGAGRLPLDVLVSPIKPDRAMIALPWAFPQRVGAIELVRDPETEIKARIDDLRARFGLTAAEAALALEIVKGDGRQAAADRLGITVGTARSHLTRIFDKTGVRHQAELVRLLLRN